jgi:starvation-inducible DNA-binding protein
MAERPGGCDPGTERAGSAHVHTSTGENDHAHAGLPTAAVVSARITRADEPAAAALQGELRDLLCLAVVGDHVRWVVTGDDGELADWLADAAGEWRELADRVAQHLVALGVAPDGRIRALAEDIALNWVPEGWLARDEAEQLLADRLHAVAAWTRVRGEQAADPDTARLLDSVSARLDRNPTATAAAVPRNGRGTDERRRDG